MKKSKRPEARTVLIADDNAEIRDLLRLHLDLAGYKIIGEASNGVEAIHLCAADNPQLVVMDWRMPIVDGAEAAAEIRESNPQTKIVAFSAFLSGEASWADATVDKTTIGYLATALDSLAVA